MFEKAVRSHLRFNYRGQCSVEDLWDLSVEELNLIFKNLNMELKITKEESLLEVKTLGNEILELKVNIVKHIVKVMLEERQVRENGVLRSEKKQKLLGLIAEKQDEALKGKSVEELNELVNSL